MYSDYFNAKVEVAVLKQEQDCEVPQTENLKLDIQENLLATINFHSALYT